MPAALSAVLHAVKSTSAGCASVYCSEQVPNLPSSPTDVSKLLAAGVQQIQAALGPGSSSSSGTAAAAGQQEARGGRTRQQHRQAPSTTENDGFDSAAGEDTQVATAVPSSKRVRRKARAASTQEDAEPQPVPAAACGRGGNRQRRGTSVAVEEGEGGAQEGAEAGLPSSQGRRSSRQQSAETAAGGDGPTEGKAPQQGSGRSRRRAATRQQPAAAQDAAAGASGLLGQQQAAGGGGGSAAMQEPGAASEEGPQGPGQRHTVYVVPNRNSRGMSPLACLLPVLRNSLTSLEITYRWASRVSCYHCCKCLAEACNRPCM